MGEVPVLVDGDTVLTQSGIILDHITEKTGQLGGATAAERAEVWRLDPLGQPQALGPDRHLRFLMNFLAPEKRPEGVIPFLQAASRAPIRCWIPTLPAATGWWAGPTIADLSCCGYLNYPEPFGFSRADWPGIDRWLDRIAALPGWKHPTDLMPGNPSDRA